MSRGSPISKVYPAHPQISNAENSVLSRPSVNWITAVSGLFGTDLIASGSSTGHVQLWRLIVDGKAFTFGSDTQNGKSDDEKEEYVKLRGRVRIHQDTTKIERVPGGEFYLVRCLLMRLVFSTLI